MAVIDVGPGAIDRTSSAGADRIYIDLTNPANGTGKIDTFEIWCASASTGVKIGTFYGSGSSYTSRDVETIGDVAGGSKQTFSGLDCDVTIDDIIGFYLATGAVEYSGGNGEGIGMGFEDGDQFGAGAQTYAMLPADYTVSIYGTGTTAPTNYDRSAAILIGNLASATRGQITITRASSVLCGIVVSATKATGDAYHRISSNLVGIVASAVRNITKIIPSSAVIVGVVSTAAKLTSRIRASSIIVGIVAKTMRLYLSFTRASSVIAGIVVTATAIEAVQRAIVYIGIKLTAGRDITKQKAASVIIGVVTTATKGIAYAITAATIIGVLASTTIRVWGRIRSSSVIVAAKITASRKIAAIRSSSVLLGVIASSTRSLALIRQAATQIGVLVSATIRTVGRVLRIVAITTQYRMLNVITTMYRAIKSITTGGQ